MSVPIYNSEVAPPQHRGRLNQLYQLVLTAFIFVAQLINLIVHGAPLLPGALCLASGQADELGIPPSADACCLRDSLVEDGLAIQAMPGVVYHLHSWPTWHHVCWRLQLSHLQMLAQHQKLILSTPTASSTAP